MVVNAVDRALNMTESQNTAEETLDEDHWLSKMGGYLDWRVIPPPISDPYSIPLSDIVLDSMAKSPAIIKKHMKMRCLCEGHELLTISNLLLPIIRTDHPCLAYLTRHEILICFDQFKLWDLVETAIARVQVEITEELHRREMVRLANRSFRRTMGQMLADTEREQKAKKSAGKVPDKSAEKKGSGGPRVIRR